LDCIELHKLTVLPADAAEEQRFYVQQVVRKPQRVTIRQYMLRMGVLNDYIAHLPSIFYSSKAVASTVKGNVIFGDGELASIILASSDSAKPHKKFGGDKQMAYMTAMFESIQKGLKKQKKGSKKRKKRYDSSSSDSDSE
jgi:hypothetical protein